MIRKLVLLLLIPTAVFAAPRLIRHAGGVPNQYMVVLHETTPAPAIAGIVRSLESSYGVRSAVTWENSLKGFLAIATEEQAAAMLADPRIAFIEQDIPGAGMTAAVETTWYGNEYLWHLDRLDDLNYGPPSPDPNGRDSTYNKCPVGNSVYAYIIDTGVWNGHEEFIDRDAYGNVIENRLTLQLDFSADQPNQAQNDPPDTTNACITANPAGGWHGTAVASLVAGKNVGAAETKVISLKIAQCNTSGSPGFSAASLVSALDWINSPTRNQFRSSPGVINFSGFLFPFDLQEYDAQHYPSVSLALSNTVYDTKFPFFTSADNFSTNSCRFFPNDLAYTKTSRQWGIGDVFVVGATSTGTTQQDPYDYRYQRWLDCPTCTYMIGQDSGSNGGACVSAYAPGVSIWAARNAGPTSYARGDGSRFFTAK